MMRLRQAWPLSFTVLCAAAATAAVTDPTDLADVAQQAPPVAQRCDQAIAGRDFDEIFDCGDELFETSFNALDGVGADVGNGKRFTSVPRFDLARYASHVPKRVTGPNGQACTECHLGNAIGGGGDGSGPATLNNIQDLAGIPGVLNPLTLAERNPPHLFGLGATQLLGEEMTIDLRRIRDDAVQQACASSQPVTAPLTSKGVSFGQIRVVPTGCPSPLVDTSGVQGVDPDLSVVPFGWKGNFPSVRLFTAGAFHNELGITPTEFSGPDVDLDFDGVMNELSVEDVSATTLYLAAQPRPTTLIELDNVRRILVLAGEEDRIDDLFLPTLTQAQRNQINRGSNRFNQIGCNGCHVPSLQTNGVTFAEPSRIPDFRFDFGVDPRVPVVVDVNNPLTFDITRDQPDNVIRVGNRVIRLGSFEPNGRGGAIVRSYSDLKRHDMGAGLAESAPDGEPLDATVSIPGNVFRTRELWGVGSTAPYLHDGRATTIEEAILEHGGEAAAARDDFRALPASAQADLLAFLNNLVLYFPAADD
jgi:hypothetical protein